MPDEEKELTDHELLESIKNDIESIGNDVGCLTIIIVIGFFLTQCT